MRFHLYLLQPLLSEPTFSFFGVLSYVQSLDGPCPPWSAHLVVGVDMTLGSVFLTSADHLLDKPASDGLPNRRWVERTRPSARLLANLLTLCPAPGRYPTATRVGPPMREHLDPFPGRTRLASWE